MRRLVCAFVVRRQLCQCFSHRGPYDADAHIHTEAHAPVKYGMGGSREGTGGPDPPKNHKNIGFLCNTGPDPLKKPKLPSQHSMLAIIGPPANMPMADVAGMPMMAHL